VNLAQHQVRTPRLKGESRDNRPSAPKARPNTLLTAVLIPAPEGGFNALNPETGTGRFPLESDESQGATVMAIVISYCAA